MANRSSYFERFFIRVLLFSTLIALIVVGIPTLIVDFPPTHVKNASSGSTSASPTRVSPPSKVKPVSQTLSEVDPSKLVTLGWTAGNANQFASYDHLQIVSPLFATIDSAFKVHINSSSASITNLQNEGKKVWGRLTLGTQSHSATHQFLTHPQVWKQVIKEIMLKAQNDHLDGLNLDIEQIPLTDRLAFSQFVKELSQTIINHQMTLSVDIQPQPMDASNTLVSFNQQLSKYSDYIIFMGYDQHWSTDSTPGPVTSLTWLEENIKQLVSTGISPQKLVIGLPSYTRIWQIDPHGHTVKSLALANHSVDNLMKQRNLQGTWDPKQAIYTISYSKNGKKYRVWLTNDRSLQIYFDLVEQYHLAGVGIWNLDMMSSNEWNQLINQI